MSTYLKSDCPSIAFLIFLLIFILRSKDILRPCPLYYDFLSSETFVYTCNMFLASSGLANSRPNNSAISLTFKTGSAFDFANTPFVI